jgi:hypothetical protein
LSACVILVSLSSFLPVTVAGAGTRDALFLLLLAPLGVTHPEALALAGLNLILFLGNCVMFYAVSVAAGRLADRK